MRNTLFKKLISSVMIVSMVVSATGCSKILEGIASKEVTEIMTDALDAFYSDPVGGLADYDDSYEVPELLEESLDLALDGISSTTYEIGEIEFNKNRTTAEVPVTFSDVIQVEDIPMGTADEVSDALGDCDKDDVTVTITLKNKNGDWSIEDMSELVDVFFTPYESLIFTDENGMPTSFYQPFFDEHVVDFVWYEPLMSQPYTGSSISGTPQALTACVYFDSPVYMTFTADLIKNGDVVQSIEVNVDGGTTAYCEFYGQVYSNGSYTVELLFDDGVVAASPSISVN